MRIAHEIQIASRNSNASSVSSAPVRNARQRRGKEVMLMAIVRNARFVALLLGLLLCLSWPGRSQSPCDLNQDGAVNVVDVQWATNMALGLIGCTASLNGTGVCNIIVVQRVINAALGGTCLVDGGSVSHSATLNWTASTSGSVSGYNIYRSTTSGSSYTKVNASLISGLSYTDATVQAGQTYYYVATSVDGSNNESGYSNEAAAVVPSP